MHCNRCRLATYEERNKYENVSESTVKIDANKYSLHEDGELQLGLQAWDANTRSCTAVPSLRKRNHPALRDINGTTLYIIEFLHT